MSGEDNPYLPPATDEPEALSGPGWKLMGLTLVVNHGTTLPKVDLENGTSTGELKNVELRHRKKILKLGELLPFSIILIPAIPEELPEWVRWILVFAPATIIWASGYVGKSRKRSSAPRQEIITIREFVTHQRLSKQARKKTIKKVVLLTVAASFIGVIAMCYINTQPNFQAIAGLFSFATLAVIGVTVWEHVTRPRLKISDGSGDSITISPIHPDAFEFLRREAEEQHQAAKVTNPRKPLPLPAFRNTR